MKNQFSAGVWGFFAEPDHSGTADWLLERFPKMQLFMSAQAAKMLGQFLEKDYSDRITLIKEGIRLYLSGVSV